MLVTGASSGIGKACTVHLAMNGFHVFAGARKERDLDTLRRVPNVQPVKLDVTNQDDIDATFSLITEMGMGLHAIVNNAGIVFGGPLIDVTAEELENVFAVNLLSVHRITRAFSPLIIAARGRIVMMSSGSGKLANPFSGPYAMSKFGLEGYADALRRELQLVGVKVIVIEPGPIDTPINEQWAALFRMYEDRPYIDETLRGIVRALIASRQANPGNPGLPPERVATVVHGALVNARPRPRYRVVSAKEACKIGMMKLLGDRGVDRLFQGVITGVARRLDRQGAR